MFSGLCVLPLKGDLWKHHRKRMNKCVSGGGVGEAGAQSWGGSSRSLALPGFRVSSPPPFPSPLKGPVLSSFWDSFPPLEWFVFSRLETDSNSPSAHLTFQSLFLR